MKELVCLAIFFAFVAVRASAVFNRKVRSENPQENAMIKG